MGKYIVLFVWFFFSFRIYSQQLDTIQVHEGWNNIGALQGGVTAHIITTIPSYIIISSFFGYGPPYYAADTLSRGEGYWVKTSQAGKIVLGINTPFVCGTSQVFYANRYYNTVQIGIQCWLRENLDVGVMIPGTQDQVNNGIIEKYCYGNDSTNCNPYGALYKWNETMQYSTTPGIQGICPIGWHIPTQIDFSMLLTTVSYNASSLKAVGQGTGTASGTNTSGFSILLAGDFANENFINIRNNYFLWSSTADGPETAYILAGYYDINEVGLYGTWKIWGFSVRCVRD